MFGIKSLLTYQILRKISINFMKLSIFLLYEYEQNWAKGFVVSERCESHTTSVAACFRIMRLNFKLV